MIKIITLGSEERMHRFINVDSKILWRRPVYFYNIENRKLVL